ncbi:MAG: hypothetical protein U5Q03_14365 [Bacteroidota bacterium]|nr:hypothetical protein [Bacteroidota bacterium]
MQSTKLLLDNKVKSSEASFPESVNQKLIQELELHQVELELQNEELKLAKEKAELAEKNILNYMILPLQDT